ncbi:hypothetical protein ACFQVA_32525 [Actinomadura keratinilytica]
MTKDDPTMHRIGCTMTGGSSGGGWVAEGADGKPALVSNTSIGPVNAGWLAPAGQGGRGHLHGGQQEVRRQVTPGRPGNSPGARSLRAQPRSYACRRSARSFT